MSALLISIIFGVGAATWMWPRLAHRTGNSDPKQVALTAGGIGLLVFIVVYVLLKSILSFA